MDRNSAAVSGNVELFQKGTGDLQKVKIPPSLPFKKKPRTGEAGTGGRVSSFIKKVRDVLDMDSEILFIISPIPDSLSPILFSIPPPLESGFLFSFFHSGSR